MIGKIDILGIEIDDCSVSEAIHRTESFLNNISMNTIQTVSMEILVNAKEDQVLESYLKEMDLILVGEKEIFQVAGITNPQRIHEITQKIFLKEFLKRILQNSWSLYLLGDTEEQLGELKQFFYKESKKISVIGSSAMEFYQGNFDGLINEINIASPDIICSVVSSPEQEYFLMEHKSKISAKVWYGLGSFYRQKTGVSALQDRLKKIVNKTILHKMISKYQLKE